jgi:bifunctional DNA-binding transcriptional regulator/antitoxin component of YhaV-PrlF toxin-antitoxin module
MAEKQTFETILEKHENMDATGITIPFDVEKVFGAKRVPVIVSIGGAEHRSTIIKMNGNYVVGVPKVFRAAANVNPGDTITVSIEKDEAKRTIEVPQDLAEALKRENLTEAFAKMSFTHQKEYVRAIEEAKREETRLKRIEKTIEYLISKRK